MPPGHSTEYPSLLVGWQKNLQANRQSVAIEEKNAVMMFFADRYTIASCFGASCKPIFVRDRLIPAVTIPVIIFITAGKITLVYSFADMPTKHHAIMQQVYRENK